MMPEADEAPGNRSAVRVSGGALAPFLAGSSTDRDAEPDRRTDRQRHGDEEDHQRSLIDRHDREGYSVSTPIGRYVLARRDDERGRSGFRIAVGVGQ
jgi:hypothetical protein